MYAISFINNFFVTDIFLDDCVAKIMHAYFFCAWDYNACCARVYKLPTGK
jgi:hypothetical protein